MFLLILSSLFGCGYVTVSDHPEMTTKVIRCVAPAGHHQIEQTVFVGDCVSYSFSCSAENGCRLACYPGDTAKEHTTEIFRADMRCYEDIRWL